MALLSPIIAHLKASGISSLKLRSGSVGAAVVLWVFALANASMVWAPASSTCAWSLRDDEKVALLGIEKCFSRLHLLRSSYSYLAGKSNHRWKEYFLRTAGKTTPSSGACDLNKPKQWVAADCQGLLQGQCYSCTSANRDRLLVFATSSGGLLLGEAASSELPRVIPAMSRVEVGYRPHFALDSSGSMYTASVPTIGPKIVEAARTNQVDTLSELLAEGPDPQKMREHGFFPLQAAIEGDHAEAVLALATWDPESLTPEAFNRDPFLHAARDNKVKSLKALLEFNANRGGRGYFPKSINDGDVLSVAAVAGSVEALEVIVAGSTRRLPREASVRALKDAWNAKQWKAAAIIASRGDFWPITDEIQFGFYTAAGAGDLEAMKAFLAQGAYVDFVAGTMGWTPAMLAASQGQIEALELIFERGGKLYEKDKEGRTLLKIALLPDNPRISETVRLLAQWMSPSEVSGDPEAARILASQGK